MICQADCSCYACGLRRKGVQVAPSAMSARNRPQPHRPTIAPSFEQAVVGETRRDGSFMPVLTPGTDRPMPIHHAAGQRTRIDQQVSRLKSDPYVFQKAGSR